MGFTRSDVYLNLYFLLVGVDPNLYFILVWVDPLISVLYIDDLFLIYA